MITVKSHFGKILGIQIAEWGPGIVRIDFPVREEFRNLSGAVHGGVLSALIDFAGSMSGNHPQFPGHWPDNVVSLSLSVNFVRPARGDILQLCGKSNSAGSSVFMSTIEVHDSSTGILVATGLGAFKISGASADGTPGEPADKL